MQKQAQEIRYFFYSQAFADGVRTTFAILIPALLGSLTGHFDLGLTLSTGALCVSIADAPGPVIHKKNGMLICAALIFLVSALTSLARMNLYTLGLEIVVLSFFFSMFTVYGNRASAVGNACLLILIFTMDKPIPSNEIAFHSLLTLIGGIWYATISLIFNSLQPYRPAERILGDSIREVARYLSVKAAFYDPHTRLDEAYRKLVAQQIVVSEKQDAVRELLFKTRQIVNESTAMGRKLVMTFVETVDLFEDITATYYDYEAIRTRYGHSGILEKVSLLIHRIAQELDHAGVAIQLRAQYVPAVDFDSQLRHLKEAIDGLSKTDTESNLVLKKILVNMRKLVTRFRELTLYFEMDQKSRKPGAQLDHTHFVSHQPLDPSIFWNNLNLDSGVFKHSIRVMTACFTGFMIVKFISSGHHSYWILLTIAFIIKPAYSLTKQRNIQRILG
ncbi:MAG TPA: FUSC family protein, partial [Flavisolibacter sp.]|nr:FUSC family protein [Flavisolibacter sp.]